RRSASARPRPPPAKPRTCPRARARSRITGPWRRPAGRGRRYECNASIDFGLSDGSNAAIRPWEPLSDLCLESAQHARVENDAFLLEPETGPRKLANLERGEVEVEGFGPGSPESVGFGTLEPEFRKKPLQI